MNDGSGPTNNSAAHGSTVGIQASTVHNSNVYVVPPDASPQEKYQVGVRYLEDGVPSRARGIIADAIAHGHDGADVRFHLVLAVLSARTYHDLSTEEIRQLHSTAEIARTFAEDEWKAALRVAFDLLAVLSTPNGETGPVQKQLHDLPFRQHNAILRHLDLMLSGGLKDDLWAETRERARVERFGKDRSRRVWAYFAPDPIGARAVLPRPSTAAAAKSALPSLAVLFAVSSMLLWILALTVDPVEAAAELPMALCAGLTAAHFGARWRGQDRGWDPTAGAHIPVARGPADAENGFANSVRHSFDHYFSIRTPHGYTSDAWLAYTAHVRGSLAAEVAHLYRESRISVDRVAWLIRYLAEDTRNRFNNGTLFGQHDQNRTPDGTKVLTLAALGILSIAALAAFGTVLSEGDPLRALWALLAVLGAAWSGYAAASRWLEVRREAHRLARETRVYHEQLAARQAAFQRWQSLLDGIRPSELEMETWLACDKTSFVDEALRHYRLTWRDLTTHTILVAPARPYKRGRVRGGPWRYSQYVFRLFLFTQDGIREISAEFDFADGTRKNEQRSNYRFDALSSVQVTENVDVGYDLELVLTNGPARKIRVKDADAHQLASDENSQEISEINLSAAGSTHTFRLLEGIAADGKGWIERHSPKNLSPFQIAGSS